MRKLSLLLAFLSIVISGYTQTAQKEAILKEGTKLYKTEMASWYGTDLFVEKFNSKRSNVGGYLSYIEKDSALCIFYSKDVKPKVLAAIKFDSTYNINTARIDDRERDLTEKEHDLAAIRNLAMKELRSDTLFKFYQDMNPNLVPLNDEDGKRVYILTGPEKHGIVVFGNDYLLTFDQQNKLKEKKRLHKNIITIENNPKTNENVVSTMHSHLPETGDLITATDICTLKLYSRFTTWKSHLVISDTNVSLWDCQKGTLVVVPRNAFDKISR